MTEINSVFKPFKYLKENPESPIKFIQENPDWHIPPSAPSLVTHTGNIVNKTSGDWKNHLENIKKGSGSGNSIKV